MNHLVDNPLPRHVAIIMDGNGRWAQRRSLTRTEGHKSGVNSAREVVECAGKLGIEVLSLFAFSSENWNRPAEEVDVILGLFLAALYSELDELTTNNVRIRVIGSQARFSNELRKQIVAAEQSTRHNTGLMLVIAADYGGQWDITQATQKITQQVLDRKLSVSDISPELISQHLVLADFPDPDLFIRTSGEQRISNFYLWQLAYSELYFSSCHWPDFDAAEFTKAIDFFASRQRRFGQTGEQIVEAISKKEALSA